MFKQANIKYLAEKKVVQAHQKLIMLAICFVNLNLGMTHSFVLGLKYI